VTIIVDDCPPSPPLGQMYGSVSSDWLTAYEQTVIQVSGYAEIWSGMSPNPEGDFDNTLLLGDILVTAGTVTIDRSNVIRRTATNITLLPDAAGDLMPYAVSDFFGEGYYEPYGRELKLFQGITYFSTPVPGTQATYEAANSIFGGGPYTVITGTNDTFQYYNASDWPAEEFTIAAGTYGSAAAYVTAFLAATGSLSGEPFSTYFTIVIGGFGEAIITANAVGTSHNGDNISG
jgi:hypothetical protein